MVPGHCRKAIQQEECDKRLIQRYQKRGGPLGRDEMQKGTPWSLGSSLNNFPVFFSLQGHILGDSFTL